MLTLAIIRVLMMRYWTYLELCGDGLFWFSCFPLKLDNCDGSPVRAVAWFEE